MTARRDEFFQWLMNHVRDLETAPALFVSEIADEAERIFTRQTYSVAISREAIPDQEIHGNIVAGDRKRLLGLQERVEKVMADGAWRTLEAISERVQGISTSVSTRLRQAESSGRWRKERRLKASGLYEYRLFNRNGK